MPAATKPRALVPALAALGLGAAALAALLLFFHLDRRPPADLGHYFRPLPEAWAALGPPVRLPALLDIAGQPGGLYNLLVAGLCRVFGRSAAVLEAVEAGWLGLLLLGTWGVGRALGGPRAGLASVALLASFPMFQTGARCHWIHQPEVALVALGLWAVLADRSLGRRATRVVLGLLVALLLTLRPTGLLYALPILGLAGWTSRSVGRLVVPLLGLVPGLLVLGPALPAYLQGKVDVRDLYAQVVVPFLPSLAPGLFRLPAVVALVGVAALVATRWRDALRVEVLLLGGWLVLAAGLCLLFKVGPDNFPVLGLVLALLGGAGLAGLAPGGWRAWSGGLVLGGLALGSLALPFLPRPLAARLAVLADPAALAEEPRFYLRPQFDVPTVEGLGPVLDRICTPRDDICTLVATTGIFNLNREDDARLALFLAGRDGIRIANAGEWWFPSDLADPDAVEGLVVVRCGGPGGATGFGDREQALEDLARTIRVRPVERLRGPMGCEVAFLRVEEEDSRAAIQSFWSARQRARAGVP